MSNDTDTKIVFIPFRPAEQDKFWGVLCPNCHRVHEIGKYSLVHRLEGTSETLVRLQEATVACRFCDEKGIQIPLFIDRKDIAAFYNVLDVETDVHLYCSGTEIHTEPIDPRVFHQLVKATNAVN